MNIIEKEAKDFIKKFYVGTKINTIENLNEKLSTKLYSFNRDINKLEFLNVLRNDTLLQENEHLKTCPTLDCDYLKYRKNGIFVIDQEIDEIKEIKENYIFEQKKDEKLIANNIDIFIVHGQNNEFKNDLARTLEKVGLKPIILHEQPNTGRTIIEKFEQHSNVGFAIVLLTDDDLGKSKKEDNLIPRARQNVILELGYFIGKLGRKRVCVLYMKGIELPSDINGLLYIEINNNDSWKFNISKELKAAGYDIDMNKI